ncbi:MAG: cbb3-type cytochrome c oxidase subunit I, partial [Pseudomonadota bacterium]|nr:cbb3-type cytochrome c oxidase subunit I [Pseudomonadota bacterium]
MSGTTAPMASGDRIADILKWLLLLVAVVCFGLLGWATVLTYRNAPPVPASVSDAAGRPIMSDADIVAGKAGFQKADLMDYGSIYGMGSYFGEDYTASTLVRLGEETRNNVALASYGRPFAALAPEQQYVATEAMRAQLQHVDLTQAHVVAPQALAGAIRTLQSQLATSFHTVNLAKGWTPARSLTPEGAAATGDFVIYSALTTVARRPGMTSSWTENWPYEPLVGNVPTTNTFRWTWISFCFTFFSIGAVLFIYQAWLNHPDDAPRERGLAEFRPLTPSQKRIGKYFVVVALVFLASMGAGAIMAHSYYDRVTFYGIQLNYILPFNFLRSFHTQAPIIWIGLGWIGSGLFLAPAIAGGREARGQAILVDILFWVTLTVVAGALVGNYLGVLGVIDKGWFWFGNQGLSY